MPLFNVYLFLLGLYVISCLWVIKRYYRLQLGVFQAPFIFALASMLMTVPQFSVIIYNPYYDPNLLWDLTFMMITCTWAFTFGWEKAQNKVLRFCKDLNIKKAKSLFFIFFIVGLYCAYASFSEVETHFAAGGGDIRGNHNYQILLFFMLYLDISMFYALTYIIKERKVPKVIWLILIVSSLYYLYIVLVLARRTIVVKLGLSLSLLLSIIYPKWKSKIKICLVLFFTLGTIYQASIGDIRGNLHGTEQRDINYWENYKQSFYSPDLTYGMDLGNAALFIKYTKEHWTYNYGTFIWDNIVTWYFPSFIFGKDGKESLKLAGANNKYIESITHNVSTRTGYYEAFATFGYLGFILFYVLGYLFGFIWKRKDSSSLYLIMYLSFMYQIPSLASHGISFSTGQLITFTIFCMPFISLYSYREKITSTNNKIIIK